MQTVDHLHLLLMGKTGSGVSASGNTILGLKVFPSRRSLTSITDRCQQHTAEVSSRRVTVLDTPNFFHSSDIDLTAELKRGLKTVSSVHAFLLVVPLHTFTQQDADTVLLFKQMFGENAMKHTLVLFTHGDELENQPLDELIRRNAELSKLTEECGGRFHLLNNTDLTNREQVNKLLMKIQRMLSVNDHGCYTSHMFETQSRKVLLQRFTKPACVFAVSVVIAFALGCVNMKNEGSWDVKSFVRGCVGGVLSAVAGAASGYIWAKIWKYQSRRIGKYPETALRNIQLLGIMCGCGAAGISVYFVGPVGFFTALLRGTDGALVAYTTINYCREL